MTTKPSDYDELYKQIDFRSQPFGGNKDYIEWLKTKINTTMASNLKSGKVLDTGGGYGYLKHFLSENQIYFNLEYSKEIQKYDESSYRVMGSGLSLPFKNNSFENVVSGDVLEHVPDKRKYLKECFRVLKHDGVFVINTPTIGTTLERYYNSIWFYFFGVGAFIRKLFRPLFYKPTKSNALTIPKGVLDEPSDEKWLYDTINNIGFTVVDGRRTAVHIPFCLDGKIWRKLSDIFIDNSYGIGILFVCRKEIDKTKSKSFDSMNLSLKREYFIKRNLTNISKKLAMTFNIQ